MNDDLSPLPTEPRMGIYRHYKGNRYEVLGLARHSETLEVVVVYRALYGDNDLWVRPIELFVGTLVYDGLEVQRFTPEVGDQQINS